MRRRTYNQSCGIARALDLLGERWTLLILRDLMIGPRRYTDLLAGLPGIGSNLLAERLKRLEGEGLIARRTLPEPAESVTVYDLAPAGRELEPVLFTLVRWSWRHLPPPKRGQRSDARWTALALRASFDPSRAAGVRCRYRFDLPGGSIWARVEDGAIETGVGEIERPDCVLRADERALWRIRDGEIGFDEAVSSGLVQVEGALEEVAFKLAVFSRH